MRSDMMTLTTACVACVHACTLFGRYRKFAPQGRLFFSRFCDTLGVLGMLDQTLIAERLFAAFDADGNGEVRGGFAFASRVSAESLSSSRQVLPASCGLRVRPCVRLCS